MFLLNFSRAQAGPIWAHMGPYGPIGPLWAHMGPILLKKSLIFIKKHEIINENIEVVKLRILKVKTWFWNKDLSSLDSINQETHKGKLSLIHI